jgi:DMSO reductase anchor subunit
MHPAVSVIFFTVTSGAGLGLIFLLGLGFPVDASAGRVFLVGVAAGVSRWRACWHRPSISGIRNGPGGR